MVSQKVSPRASVVILASILALVGVCEWRALSASDPPPRTIDRAYCAKCHSDSAMMRKMQEKEGGAGFLFTDKSGPWASPSCPQAGADQTKSPRLKPVPKTDARPSKSW